MYFIMRWIKLEIREWRKWTCVYLWALNNIKNVKEEIKRQLGKYFKVNNRDGNFKCQVPETFFGIKFETINAKVRKWKLIIKIS